MFRCGFIILIVATCCSGLPTEFQKRIVGGKPYSENGYPFHVSLWFDREHSCGGTLVATNWVLTAGHCFDNDVNKKSEILAKWIVYVGIYKLSQPDQETQARIEKLVRADSYDREKRIGDLVLLKLDKHFPINRVAELNKDKNCLQVGTTVQAIGWGQTSKTVFKSDVPKLSNFKVVDKADCGKKYYQRCRESTVNYFFSEKLMCAQHPQWTESTAKGDSGSPLLANCNGKTKVVGVVSWGIAACKEIGYPTVFTVVNSYSKWIEKVTKKN